MGGVTGEGLLGVVLAGIGLVFVVGARRLSGPWMRVYQLDRTRMLPPQYSAFVGSLLTAAFGLGLIALGAALWFGL